MYYNNNLSYFIGAEINSFISKIPLIVTCLKNNIKSKGNVMNSRKALYAWQDLCKFIFIMKICDNLEYEEEMKNF